MKKTHLLCVVLSLLFYSLLFSHTHVFELQNKPSGKPAVLQMFKNWLFVSFLGFIENAGMCAENVLFCIYSRLFRLLKSEKGGWGGLVVVDESVTMTMSQGARNRYGPLESSQLPPCGAPGGACRLTIRGQLALTNIQPITRGVVNQNQDYYKIIFNNCSKV